MSISMEKAYPLRWWTLLTISVSVIVIVLDTSILNVALPTLQKELSISGAGLQWILNIYMMAFAALMLTSGALGDRLGRARMLQAGIAVFALGSLAASFATTSGQLIAWRAVMGVGGAMILPATLAIITNLFPSAERPKAIGVWAGINGIGVALGPIIGGLILDNLSWHWIFLVNLPVAAVALVMGWFFVPDSQDTNPKRLDLLGTFLSALVLGALVYGLINGSVRGWTDPWVLGTLAGAVAAGTAFVLWERHVPYPMLEMGFFKNPRFSAGVLAVSIMALALIGINYSLTLYMQFVNGYTPLQAGVRFVPVALGILFGAGSAGRLVGRLGTKRVMVSGFLGTIAMVFLAYFWQVGTPYWQIGLIFFGYAFCLGYIAAPAADAIMGALPKARAGIGSAMNSVSRMVAGSIGVAALGSALNSIYTASFDKAAAGLPLPAEAVAAARDSVGAAVAVAGRLPAEVGNTLAALGKQSFMDGFHTMVLISCVICAAGCLLVALAMPARAREEPAAVGVPAE